jgi:hypothetical protein
MLKDEMLASPATEERAGSSRMSIKLSSTRPSTLMKQQADSTEQFEGEREGIGSFWSTLLCCSCCLTDWLSRVFLLSSEGTCSSQCFPLRLRSPPSVRPLSTSRFTFNRWTPLADLATPSEVQRDEAVIVLAISRPSPPTPSLFSPPPAALPPSSPPQDIAPASLALPYSPQALSHRWTSSLLLLARRQRFSLSSCFPLSAATAGCFRCVQRIGEWGACDGRPHRAVPFPSG